MEDNVEEENAKVIANEQAGERKLWYHAEPFMVISFIITLLMYWLSTKI